MSLKDFTDDDLKEELDRRAAARLQSAIAKRERRAELLRIACEGIKGFQDEFIGKDGTDSYAAVFGDSELYSVRFEADYCPLENRE